jgi:mRNA interferase RelE/StbE
MSYTITLSRDAMKILDKIDRKTEQRIQDRFEELKVNPFDARISKHLTMDPTKRYSRVGNWRIIYSVDQDKFIVDVAEIQPRSRAYRDY